MPLVALAPLDELGNFLRSGVSRVSSVLQGGVEFNAAMSEWSSILASRGEQIRERILRERSCGESTPKPEFWGSSHFRELLAVEPISETAAVQALGLLAEMAEGLDTTIDALQSQGVDLEILEDMVYPASDITELRRALLSRFSSLDDLI